MAVKHGGIVWFQARFDSIADSDEYPPDFVSILAWYLLALDDNIARFPERDSSSEALQDYPSSLTVSINNLLLHFESPSSHI